MRRQRVLFIEPREVFWGGVLEIIGCVQDRPRVLPRGRAVVFVCWMQFEALN